LVTLRREGTNCAQLNELFVVVVFVCEMIGKKLRSRTLLDAQRDKRRWLICKAGMLVQVLCSLKKNFFGGRRWRTAFHDAKAAGIG